MSNDLWATSINYGVTENEGVENDLKVLSSVQLLSYVRLFVTPWTAAHQASLSITNSQSLLKLMSSESVMPSNHLILCHPLLLLPSIFPSIRIFSSESVFCIKWPKYWSLTSASVLPVNIQDWFPLGMDGWISLQFKGLSRVFSNTIVQLNSNPQILIIESLPLYQSWKMVNYQISWAKYSVVRATTIHFISFNVHIIYYIELKVVFQSITQFVLVQLSWG